MKTHITTNIKAETEDFEAFKVLCVKKDKKKGEYIGDLIAAEVRKNIKLIQGEER